MSNLEPNGSFLPNDLSTTNTDLPTVFAKANGFSVGDDLLPELRGSINYDRPAEERWKVYRGGGFAPCKPGGRDARRYLRIVAACCCGDSGTSRAIRSSTTGSESVRCGRIETVYPGTFSAMISPLRS